MIKLYTKFERNRTIPHLVIDHLAIFSRSVLLKSKLYSSEGVDQIAPKSGVGRSNPNFTLFDRFKN